MARRRDDRFPDRQYVDPARSHLTVGSLAEQWINGKVSLKPTTRVLYDSVLSTHVLPRWREVPLTRVEHGDVQTWVAQLVAAGLSAGHVRKVHGVLSGILSLAVRDRRLPSNPALGVDLPHTRERPRRCLNAAQVEQLAAAAGDGRLPFSSSPTAGSAGPTWRHYESNASISYGAG